MAFVKIGDKGRHLQIPDGWRLLEKDEVVKKGDKVAFVHELRWVDCVESDDMAEKEVGETAYFVGDFVITEINPKGSAKC